MPKRATLDERINAALDARMRQINPPPAVGQRTLNETDEIGSIGTVYYSGFLDSEEYNIDLQGSKAITVYTTMSRSDAQVIAILRSIVLPIRGAVPKLQPASDDPADVDIAHKIEQGITNMAGQTWDDFVRQAIHGGLTYGHSVFEPVYSQPDGAPNYVDIDGQRLLMPYKLAPRLQKTIYRWHIDRTGELLGIQQRVFVGTLDPKTEVEAGDTRGALPYAASGSYKYIDIPIDRLMIFSFDREGANWLGVSILRSAYKHWWYKDNLLRIQALGAERHFVGVPYAIVKQGLRKVEENAVVATLRLMHAHEKAYAIFNEAQLAKGSELGMPPIGFLQMPSLGSNGRAIDLAINYHDRQMAESILADFLTLGSSIGGNANVMHRDKSSLFFNAIKGFVSHFENIVQAQLVRRIIDLNWPGAKEPKFEMTSLETRDFDRLGRGLAQMAAQRLITPSPELENQIREMMDLPLLPLDDEGNPIYPTGTDDPNAPPTAAMSERTNGHRRYAPEAEGKKTLPDHAIISSSKLKDGGAPIEKVQESTIGGGTYAGHHEGDHVTMEGHGHGHDDEHQHMSDCPAGMAGHDGPVAAGTIHRHYHDHNEHLHPPMADSLLRAIAAARASEKGAGNGHRPLASMPQ